MGKGRRKRRSINYSGFNERVYEIEISGYETTDNRGTGRHKLEEKKRSDEFIEKLRKTKLPISEHRSTIIQNGEPFSYKSVLENLPVRPKRLIKPKRRKATRPKALTKPPKVQLYIPKEAVKVISDEEKKKLAADMRVQQLRREVAKLQAQKHKSC